MQPVFHAQLSAHGIDWTALLGLITQYGPKVITAVQILLPLLTAGSLDPSTFLAAVEQLVQLLTS